MYKRINCEHVILSLSVIIASGQLLAQLSCFHLGHQEPSQMSVITLCACSLWPRERAVALSLPRHVTFGHVFIVSVYTCDHHLGT
ncbi:hypothetical protein B0F90DRAFT_1776289, partial [Multifurca ochricompacta]